MRMSAEALYALLPAIYRSRDAEEGYPLRELIAVIAEQAAVVEESIEQLYDDQFIETCSDWVAPYIGGLIGYRPLHGVGGMGSPRAEVANTIGYRRRLGTASVLEQLARDVTGWPARAVEYFLLTATSQRMNHIRPAHHFAPDLRDWRGLEAIGGAFDPFTRLADMRSIARAGGRHNFPNVGIHLWTIDSFDRAASPAVALDATRVLFSPLGAPLPLFTNPVDEERITHIATPLNVAAPIARRILHADLLGEDGAAPPRALYGRNAKDVLQSLLVAIDGVELSADEVESCDLSDMIGGWAHMPAAGEKVAIDPVLGRIALPPDRIGDVTVSFHYGFSAPIGGGPYPRAAAFAALATGQIRLRVPTDHATVQAALDALPAAGGIVEIVDNGRYEETVTIAVGADAAIELRAADGFNPHLALTGDLLITGAADADGHRETRVTLDGLLISGRPVVVPDDGVNALKSLTLRHCTLVPGRSLDAEGQPAQPGALSIEASLPGLVLEMAGCIAGPLGVARDVTATIDDSIVDAAAADPAQSASGVAYADPAGADFGGPLTLRAVTIFGKIMAERFDLVSDSILFASLAPGDTWPAPVRAERRQVGCMRFSYVPQGSITPRRYRCQPQLAIDTAIAARAKELGGPVPAAERQAIQARATRRIVPGFTSRRYGRPAYAQLRRSTPHEIRAGASDESEMGGFHLLFAPQREANLNIRLDEYLRFALEAGLFFET
ncbi:MAG TPA: hypothetical protein VMS43_01285 [Allosphingosinicella sp.]|nr:hypothetical protein [Allosphingosinicella sp.]